jgi:hypothetical protein
VKRTIVDASGDVRCPNCGARDSFVSKRTGKAKLIGVATVGVGVVAMPKRLKCNGCGTNLKRGRAAGPELSPRAKMIVWGLVVLFVVIAYATQH